MIWVFAGIVLLTAVISCCFFFTLSAHKYRNNKIVQYCINLFNMYHLSEPALDLEIRNKIKTIRDQQIKMIHVAGYGHNVLLDEDTSSHINMSVLHEAAFVEFKATVFADASTYHKILKLIRKYKPIKPISAYVLHISIHELENISDEKIYYLYQQLVITCQESAIPIYLTITGLEEIDGFQHILKYCNDPQNHELIAWTDNVIDMFSNARYTTSNINQTYQTIANYLKIHIEKLCFKISTESHPTNTTNSIAIFPEILLNKISNLKKIISTIFASQNSFFLRGIYFVGTGLDMSNFMQHIDSEELARYSTNDHSKYMKSIAIFVSIMLIMSIIRCKQMSETADRIINFLDRIENMTLSKLSQQTTKELIFIIDQIDKVRLCSAFVPLSLTYNSSNLIKLTITKAYHSLIITRIFQKFNEQMRNLIVDNQTYNAGFDSMMSYAQKSLDLYKLSYAIASIGFEGGIANINYIMRHLFNIDLPKEYNRHVNLYRSSLQFGLPSMTNIEDHKESISQNLLKQVHRFTENLIQFSGLFEAINKLQLCIENIQERPNRYSVNIMTEADNILRQIDLIFSENYANWISYNDLQSNANFNNFITIVKSCKIFDNKTMNDIQRYVQTQFIKARSHLLSLQITSIGPLFAEYQDNIYLSQNYKDFSATFQALMHKLQLLKEDNKNQNNTQLIMSIWNINKLNAIYRKVLDSNIMDTIQNMPIEMQHGVKVIVGNIFTDNINNAIDNSLIECDYRHNHTYIIDNLKKSVAIIEKIIQVCEFYGCNESSEYIVSILKQQMESLFLDIIKQVEDSHIYHPAYMPADHDDIKLELTRNKTFLINLNKNIAGITKIYKEKWNENEWSANAKIVISINDALTQRHIDELEESILAYQAMDNTDLTKCLQAIQKCSNHKYSDKYSFIESRNKIVHRLIRNKIEEIINKKLDHIFFDLLAALQKMKHFFPFSPNADDAPYNVLSTFYDVWIRNRDDVRNIILLHTKHIFPSSSNSHKYKFIAQFEQSMRWFESIIEPNVFKSSIKFTNRSNRHAEINIKYLKSFSVEFIHHDPHNNATCSINSSTELSSIDQSAINIHQRLAKDSSYNFINKDYVALAQIKQYHGKMPILKLILQHAHSIENNIVHLQFTDKILSHDLVQDEIHMFCTLDIAGHISDMKKINFNFEEYDVYYNDANTLDIKRQVTMAP